MRRRKRNIKAIMRTAHLYPRMGKSRWSMRGKTMPPMEPPVVARPVAAAREVRKKWEMEETAGVKMREVPTPPRMEKVRIKCQYSAG